MHQYHGLLREVLATGAVKKDRTGTGTTSIFGPQMRFDLRDGFPLVTTKRCHLRSIIHELLWFLNGDTNIKYLNDNNVTIWDEWADESGNLGPVYGKQWRDWVDIKTVLLWDEEGQQTLEAKGYERLGNDDAPSSQCQVYYRRSTDQISTVLEQLRNDPDNRRIIVSAWNVGELGEMALAPCHSFFQFYTRELSLEERVNWAEANDNELWSDYTHATFVDIDTRNAWLDRANVPSRALSCQLYQRSADCFLGVPFNIASYALLIHMVAQQVNMVPHEFVWTGGDVHIYSNHMEQVNVQLQRQPKALPKLIIKRKPDSIFEYKFEDFELTGYDPHGKISAPVAI